MIIDIYIKKASTRTLKTIATPIANNISTVISSVKSILLLFFAGIINGSFVLSTKYRNDFILLYYKVAGLMGALNVECGVVRVVDLKECLIIILGGEMNCDIILLENNPE